MGWVVHSQILTVAQTLPTLLKSWPLVVATRSSCVPSHLGGEAHGHLRDSSGPRPHLLVHPMEWEWWGKQHRPPSPWSGVSSWILAASILLHACVCLAVSRTHPLCFSRTHICTHSRLSSIWWRSSNYFIQPWNETTTRRCVLYGSSDYPHPFGWKGIVVISQLLCF